MLHRIWGHEPGPDATLQGKLAGPALGCRVKGSMGHGLQAGQEGAEALGQCPDLQAEGVFSSSPVRHSGLGHYWPEPHGPDVTSYSL